MITMKEVREKYPQYNDLTDEQLAKALHGKYYADMPYEEFSGKIGIGNQPKTVEKQNVFGKEGFANAMRETLNEATGFDKKAAAFGSGARNLYEGGKQMLGLGDERAIEGNRLIRESAPVSAFAGDVSTFVPTALIPGANTMTGAAVTGGSYGLLQPTDSTAYRAANTTLGAMMGPIGFSVGDDATRLLQNRFARKTAEAAERQAMDSVKNETIEQGRKAGYKLPPSAVGKSSIAETLSGQQKTQQAFSWENQKTTNKLWRDEFGLDKTAPITQETMDQVRDNLEEAYRAIEKMGTLQVSKSPYAKATELQRFGGMQPYKETQYTIDAGKTIFDIRDLRQKGYKLINGPYSPENESLGYQMIQESEALTDLLAEGLAKNGQHELVDELVKARIAIAKSHLGDKGIAHGSGDINSAVIADAYRKGMQGAGPKLTGNLELIGKFANTFEPQTRHRSFAPIKNSPLDSSTAAITVGAGQGHPAAIAAATVPYMRNPIRNWLLSESAQNKIMTPEYGIGLLSGKSNALPPFITEGTSLGLLSPYWFNGQMANQ